MNLNIAKLIIRASICGYLPTIIGRRKFWHKLYDLAAIEVIEAHRATYVEIKHENGWTA